MSEVRIGVSVRGRESAGKRERKGVKSRREIKRQPVGGKE